MYDDLRSAVSDDMPRLVELLSDLIRMPTVSVEGFDPAAVRSAAEHLVVLLGQMGYEGARLLESSKGHPAVFAEKRGPTDAPTVMLYAHYDVQPPGPSSEWDTPPFEPVTRDGRIYGRGASDDKAGIVMHLGAIAALGDDLPVNVQLFFEGEEEAGSAGLSEIVEKYSDLLSPDVIVIGDGGLWDTETPALLTRLRGLAAVKFEVRTLTGAVHSGQAGGIVPDALMALSRILASFHDDEGNVAVDGIFGEEMVGGIELPDELVRRETNALSGVQLIGSGSNASRLWSRPAVSIVAIDAPRVDEAINQLVPVARAKVSMRIPPGQDSADALAKLKDHITSHAPWGAEVEFLHEEAGDATTLETDNFAADAWRKAFAVAFPNEVVEMGAGGSIPFIATFQEKYPEAPILVTGVSDPTSAYHAPNENMGVAQLEMSTLAEAIALKMLAGE